MRLPKRIEGLRSVRPFELRLIGQRVIFTALALAVSPCILLFMVIRMCCRSTKAIKRPESLISSRLPVLLELKGNFFTLLHWVADVPVYIAELSPTESFATRMFRYSYPEPFHDVQVHVKEDNITLSVVAGRQAELNTNVTVIVIPGMFNTASMNFFVELACFLYYEWGVNVMVAEMRGHGKTGRMNPGKPVSLSVREASDILHVAKFAKLEWGQNQSIFLLGVSLGGTYALSAVIEDAACRLEGERLIKACATISAPMNIHGLVHRMSSLRTAGGSFNLWYAIYSWFLLRYCSLRGLSHIQSFPTFVTSLIAPSYPGEASLVGSAKQASPVYRLEKLQTPVLALYAKDDPVATISEPALLLKRAKLCNKDHMIRVEIAECGGHAAQLAFKETQQALRSFFDQHS